uniref:Uncharacterized protein n=1 Tax=Anopheles farauti TaxID=69004 RepID=A0A182Q544_9DIPT
MDDRLQQHTRPASLHEIGREEETLVGGTSRHEVEKVIVTRTKILPGLTVLDVVVITRTDGHDPPISFARVWIHQRDVSLVCPAIVVVLCGQELSGRDGGDLLTDASLRNVLYRSAPLDDTALGTVDGGTVLRVARDASILSYAPFRAAVAPFFDVAGVHSAGDSEHTRYEDRNDHDGSVDGKCRSSFGQTVCWCSCQLQSPGFGDIVPCVGKVTIICSRPDGSRLTEAHNCF